MAAALALACSPLVFLHPVRISGRSMEPLLSSGERCWALRAWCAGKPAAREVWLLQTAAGPAVKRLVALPGTRVAFLDGQLLLDGQAVAEPYVLRPDYSPGGPWDTGQGYFLLGDNRRDSHDSRAWGPVAGDRLLARILLREPAQAR